MDETAQLPIRIAKPDVEPEEIERVCAALRDKGWINRGPLAESLGISIRRLREIAEHSDGRILSAPGSDGYKLFDGKAACEDADRCASQHESQAKRQLARAAAIRRRYHRYARA